MQYQTTIKLAVFLALLAGTNACTEQVAGPSDAVASNEVKARTVKTGAGLDFAYRMQKPVTANIGHSVTLVVTHDYAGKNLSLTADSDAAVKLSVKATTISLVKGKNATWTIPFTATADGLYYINIIGKVTGADGSPQARAYAVRVEVGDQSGVKKPVVKEIILPADEKIS